SRRRRSSTRSPAPSAMSSRRHGRRSRSGRPAREPHEAVRRRRRRRRSLARHRAGEVLRVARAVGLRQDDDAAHDRRLRGPDVGPDRARRRRRERPASVQARREHRLPVVRAVPAPHDLRERRVRPPSQEAARQGPLRPRARGARPRRPRARRETEAAPAFGRTAAADRARARARQPPPRAPARRAARRARPEAPQGDAARAQAHPARGRHHVHPRHARPGRGDDHGRPDRDHGLRPHRAAGNARRAVRAAADGLRRRVPRRLEPPLRRRLRARPRAARRRHRGARAARGARRPDGQGPDRHPAGNAPDRGERQRLEHPRRRRLGERVHRRLDAGRRRHAGGPGHRLRPERSSRRERGLARRQAHGRMEPRLHLRRRRPGGHMSSARTTRAEFLRRAAAGGTVLTLPGFLAACGGGGGSSAGSTAAATGGAQTLPKTITFSNWPLYIDVNEKTKAHPTLQAFEKRYKVNVKYVEDINDNDTFFGKIQGPLSQNQSVGRDIVVLTDSSGLPDRMIQLGWLEKLDRSAIPNAKNLQPTQQHPSWDEHREYSLPWQSGMTGIGYDPNKVGGEINSISELLTNPKLKGKVTMLTEFGDSLGLVMLANGDDPSKVTDASFARAMKTLKKAVDSGQIRQFTGNDYAPLLAKGDVWACAAWSGDMVQLQA